MGNEAIPLKYQVIKTYWLLGKVEQEPKKIYFKKENKGLIWHCDQRFNKTPCHDETPSSTLPFSLSNNKWYLIRVPGSRLSTGELDYWIFIYIDNNGKWHHYCQYKPGPF